MAKLLLKYDWRDHVVANHTIFANCSACCFRNYRPICDAITCYDYARHGFLY
jgi:hypothetical protein